MAAWKRVEAGQFTEQQLAQEQEALINEYRQFWAEAVRWRGCDALEESAIRELCAYSGADPAEVQERCTQALNQFRDEWDRKVLPDQSSSIEQFYDQNQSYIYELTWWHTLCNDVSPLAYVMALHFAKRHGYTRYLDFGTGVSSGGLLFAKHGMQVSISDVSTALLHFSKWRFQERGLPVTVFDLKHEALPSEGFDLITAMDVFEHLTDPVGTVEALAKALAPNGTLFGRFHVEENDNRGQHIVRDFEPTFHKLEELGFEKVWEDNWLWGHWAFQGP